MKFNKTLICLVICLAILSQANAKKKVQKKSLVYQQFLGDWRSAKVTITGVDVFQFNSKIKDALDDANKPFGILIDGDEVIGKADATGYYHLAQVFRNFTNQMRPLGVIDFRLISSCKFEDNTSKWNIFGRNNYFIDFTLNFHEEYNAREQSQKNFGSSLKVHIELLEANKGQAQGLITNLNNNCKMRNQLITGLKKAAVQAGDNYHAIREAFENRQQTLDQQKEQERNISTLIRQIKDEEAGKTAEFERRVRENEALLQNSQQALGRIALQKQSNESEADRLSTNELATIDRNIETLRQSQFLAQRDFERSLSRLQEAQRVKEELLKKKQEEQQSQQTLDLSRQSLEQARRLQVEADQREYDRLMAEIAERQNNSLRSYEQKKQKIAQDTNALKQQNQQTNQNIERAQNNIKSTQIVINELQEQSKAIGIQIDNLQRDKRAVEENRQKLRKNANDLNEEIKRQEAQIRARALLNQQQQQDDQRVLNELKERERQQIANLQNVTEAQRNEFLTNAQKAHQQVNASLSAFYEAMNNIYINARESHIRVQSAIQQVQENLHGAQIANIVSSTDYQVNQALMRQAKQRKELQRLNKARAQTAQIIRMQSKKLRKTLKNKLRHRLNRHKY